MFLNKLILDDTCLILCYSRGLFSDKPFAIILLMSISYHITGSYIGCMRHIVVQDKHVDPLPLIKSENSVGVSVGSCDLIDWCAQQNPCLNNGLCVSEWFTSYCDCTQTHHEGSVCQFCEYFPPYIPTSRQLT